VTVILLTLSEAVKSLNDKVNLLTLSATNKFACAGKLSLVEGLRFASQLLTWTPRNGIVSKYSNMECVMNLDIIVYQELENAGFDKKQIKAQCALVENYVDARYEKLATKDDIHRLENKLDVFMAETKGDIKYLTYFMAGIFTICAIPLLYKAWVFVMAAWGINF
jgi:hypothetical protein